jgi:hypothetical protein
MKTGNLHHWKIALILIGLTTLACNLPVAFLDFNNSGNEPEKQIELAHTAVAEYEATLTSSEGQVVGLLTCPHCLYHSLC